MSELVYTNQGNIYENNAQISEIRKFLGQKFEKMSDDEVQNLLYLITGLCNRIIDTHLSNN